MSRTNSAIREYRFTDNPHVLVESILDAVPHAVIGVRNRVIIFANEAVHSVFGLHSRELTGKSTRILYRSDEDYERIGGLFYPMLARQGTFRQEFPCRRADGEDIVCVVSAARIGDCLQDRMIIATYEDVTARKNAEAVLARGQEELAILVQQRTLELQRIYAELARETAMHAVEASSRKEAEERYRRFINGTNDIVYLKDENFRYVFINDALSVFFAKPESEIIGKNDFELMPEKSARIFHNSDRRAIEVEGVVVAEDPWGERTFESRRFKVALKDGKTGVGAYLRDVTRERRLERQMLQAQKMEAIGTLAGGIAHDFNNLLMGMQGQLSLMLLDTNASHPHYDRLQAIQDQVQSGANLTRQLLGFARGGRYEIKASDINLLLGNTVSMFGRTKKEIQITEKYETTPCIVNCDRTQMEQVFMNIFVNAWQAMPAGGDLHIETKKVTVSRKSAVCYQKRPGKYVQVSVRDTGIGMDDKTIRRIFDPFFTTKEMGRGTGLGLATVYGIVKGHGGYVDVHSRPGKGACFDVYLPAAAGKAAADAKTDEGRIFRGAETILIVDDEPAIAEVSRDILEALGYRVIAASGGREALRIYEELKEEIDLVILDMVMPEMGGSETFDGLKSLNPAIRVILASGYTINSKTKEVLEKGARSFLQKPYRIEELSRKIREALDDRTTSELPAPVR